MKGKLIGYTDTGYKIYIGNKIVVSCHVKVIESSTELLKLLLYVLNYSQNY